MSELVDAAALAFRFGLAFVFLTAAGIGASYCLTSQAGCLSGGCIACGC